MVAREKRSHEFGGVVRLEVGGLVADESVARGMGSVEPVSGERFDECKNFFSDRFSDALLYAAFDEFDFLLLNEVDDLLSHGFAEYVRFAEAESGEVSRNLHDLLLVDGDAVGRAKNRLKFRMEIFDALQTVFSVDKVWNPVHGTWSIQRDHGDNVFENGWLQLLQVQLHSI